MRFDLAEKKETNLTSAHAHTHTHTFRLGKATECRLHMSTGAETCVRAVHARAAGALDVVAVTSAVKFF